MAVAEEMTRASATINLSDEGFEHIFVIRTNSLILACLSGFMESSVKRVFNFVQI